MSTQSFIPAASLPIPPVSASAHLEMPEVCTEDMLDYLDALRESGEINMFGARAYLVREFPFLRQSDASRVLSYWMETFGDRNA